MKRFFENVYYAFKLGCFIMNYKANYELGDLILKILEESEFEVKKESHHIVFVSEKYSIRMWNSNKYYAWANNGSVYCGEELMKCWTGECLPRKHMYKIKELIRKLDSKEDQRLLAKAGITL